MNVYADICLTSEIEAHENSHLSKLSSMKGIGVLLKEMHINTSLFCAQDGSLQQHRTVLLQWSCNRKNFTSPTKSSTSFAGLHRFIYRLPGRPDHAEHMCQARFAMYSINICYDTFCQSRVLTWDPGQVLIYVITTSCILKFPLQVSARYGICHFSAKIQLKHAIHHNHEITKKFWHLFKYILVV